ncbi:hypothetical protein LJ656_07230 [Paraburkholderia sp. MMS20-SJTR3]|uniref:Uncharacterized protein n=1 Tax=Paraburkholderia sejongensis TaxID=2886946 RepID=A0ABS8JR99_9BURK|nr:hypothetical protein [Paraburkholderia sp. MMS20-SJTR3]MCC8392377.1 hypothetical protein [Paraburkholderia sp. MMS20-SJTR3]
MKHVFAVLLLSLPAICVAKSPACHNWPTSMAQVNLQNAGLLPNIDDTKTKAVLVAPEKIGKDSYGEQLWRQVYHITFHDQNGSVIKVVTVDNAGEEECSITGVDVFVVSQHFPSQEHVIKGLDYSDPQTKR